MKTASLPTNPISLLWRHARAWLAEMLADFISPARIARAIAQQARAAFRERLQRLEMLVMKLLLIEATRALEPSCGATPAGGRRSTPEDRRPSARTQGESAAPWPEHPEHSLTWRVRFHTPGRRQGSRAAPRRIPHAPACAQTLALKLARRFEALRRVIADPRRAITALARKLSALGVRARDFARRIALSSPRRGGGPILADAIVHAHDASFDLPCDTS